MVYFFLFSKMRLGRKLRSGKNKRITIDCDTFYRNYWKYILIQMAASKKSHCFKNARSFKFNVGQISIC